MGKNNPRICAAIVNDDLKAVRDVEPLVDLLEIRIDLIGSSWSELVRHLKKPWIACNRNIKEGGSWRGSESERIEALRHAITLGASIIDIELNTPGIDRVIKWIKGRVDCLLSYHDLKGTPPTERMRWIVRSQLAAGADICKLVTTAQRFEDNITTLQLILDFPEIRVVSFAMGALGFTSRILSPLVGGDFIYASIEEGQESAPGQITVKDLRNIYGMLKDEK